MGEDSGGEDRPEDDPETPKLGLKDYVAIAVAALETFLLPLVILIGVLTLVAVLLRLRL
jgi:hypothetical protein